MSMNSKRAFNLVELLVVIAIIASLAALLFPVLNAAKAKAPRAVCMNHLREINLGIHLYLDDQNNGSPGNANTAHLPFVSWTGYRPLINNYVGIKGVSSPQDKVFACPADSFFYDISRGGRGYVPQPMHEQSDHAFTSYAFNAGQFTAPSRTNAAFTITTITASPGKGWKLCRIRSKQCCWRKLRRTHLIPGINQSVLFQSPTRYLPIRRT